MSKVVDSECTADDVVKYLWGDYCLKKKGFEALEGGVTGSRTFIKLVLENIWRLYEQDADMGEGIDPGIFGMSNKQLNLLDCTSLLRSREII